MAEPDAIIELFDNLLIPIVLDRLVSSIVSATAMAASLCIYCRRIDFASLRGPSLAEVNSLYAGRNSGNIYGSQSDDATSRINLGTLSRIREDASRCGLCALFAHIIDRQGAVGVSERALDTDDICFVATAGAVSSYSGSIGTRTPAQPLGFVLQRLTVTAHEKIGPSGYGTNLAYLSHVLHSRIPASPHLPLRGETYNAEEASGTMLFGARFRPLQLDVDVLRCWIEICSNEHGSHCATILGRDTGKYPVRFIDVNQMSVTTFTDVPLSKIRYIALSYVWGPAQHQKTKLIMSNVQHLTTQGSLGAMAVPQTIGDAIELTRRLGFRFLWVDALCIIQDDPSDQQIQIHNMHGIYKTASVTVFAASGKHSNAGLPGLRPGTRHYEQHETTVIDPTKEEPGLSLMTNVKSIPQSWGSSWAVGHGDIETSVWNRRAWTMQEKALSQRTMTFSEEQVTWDCPCASFSEESFSEIRILRCRSIISTSYQDLTLSSLARNESPWDLYRNLVNRFSQRDLSYPGDYNDAFAAVVEMMTDIKGERFLWALPCSRFELALSWDTIYDVYRREALSKLAMTSLHKRIQFPSWSWLGWVGHAHCSVGADRIESESPTVVCYTHRSNPLAFLPVRALGTIIEPPLPKRISVTFDDLDVHLPKLTAEVLSTFADEYLLFFWAGTARFLVRPPDRWTFRDHVSLSDNVHESRPTTLDGNGIQVGTACRMKGEHWAMATAGFDEQWYDFIAVGRRAVPEVPEYPATILALQIEWVEDIAHRINMVEIGEEAWLASTPKRALVALG